MAWYPTLMNNQSGGGVELVTWQDGTDEQIAAMINAYYEGKLTLEQIQEVWTVGDYRLMPLSAISSSGTYNNNTWSVGESHSAKNAADKSNWVKVEILDFDHDTLTTSIGSITKALLTVDLKECLRADGISDIGGSENTERGYMNNSNTNSGGWTSCARRAWCNGGFYQALPEYMRTLVKPVDKLTSAGSQSSTINTTSDYIFLPSEIEIFDSTTYSFNDEGTVYTYFNKGTSYRYKKPGWNSSYPSSSIWWERSPRSSGSSHFCFVGIDGSANAANASSTRGLAPAWCL